MAKTSKRRKQSTRLLSVQARVELLANIVLEILDDEVSQEQLYEPVRR